MNDADLMRKAAQFLEDFCWPVAQPTKEAARALAAELLARADAAHGVVASDGKGLRAKDADALPHGFRE